MTPPSRAGATGAKKAAKAPAKKAAATKAPAKKATKASVATKAAAKRAAATKAPAKKTAPAARAQVATKAPAKRAAATKAPAKKAAPAARAPVATKAPAKKAAPEKKAPARAKAPIGPYADDPKFLEEQRVILLSERSVYQGQAEALKAEADSLAQEREPGDVQFDEESGEGGTVTVDRERDLALSAQALAAVEEIEASLERITKKTYGACERCHQPIMKARLRALPYARLCVACKSGGLSRR